MSELRTPEEVADQWVDAWTTPETIAFIRERDKEVRLALLDRIDAVCDPTPRGSFNAIRDEIEAGE